MILVLLLGLAMVTSWWDSCQCLYSFLFSIKKEIWWPLRIPIFPSNGASTTFSSFLLHRVIVSNWRNWCMTYWQVKTIIHTWLPYRLSKNNCYLCYLLCFHTLHSYLTVELMRTGGLTPTEAAREAISRIVEFYPDFDGSILAASKDGTFGKNT